MPLIKGKQIAPGAVTSTNIDQTEIPTLGGVDTFTGTVSVPEPVASSDATTKNYVDQRVNITLSAVPTKANKAMTSLVTSIDGDLACSIPIAVTPSGDGLVRVMVNGINFTPADGVIDGADSCYFSTDGGVTALRLSDISKGALLYWKGSYAGFQLNGDSISFSYNVNGTNVGPGVTRLIDESDVSIPPIPVNGSTLTFNSTKGKWVDNLFVPSQTLMGMKDVSVTDTGIGQTLVYNGSSWTAQVVGSFAQSNELFARWAGSTSGLDLVVGPTDHTQMITVTATASNGSYVMGPLVMHASMDDGATWVDITVDLTSVAPDSVSIATALNADSTFSKYFSANGSGSLVISPLYAFYDFKFWFSATPMFYGLAFVTNFPTVYSASLGWAGYSFPIVSGSWSAGTATLVLSQSTLRVGQTISVSGVVAHPGYNTASAVITAVDNVLATISYALVSNPGGTITSDGSVGLSTDVPVTSPTDAISKGLALRGGTNNGTQYTVEVQDATGGVVTSPVTVFIDPGVVSTLSMGVMSAMDHGSTVLATTTVGGLKGYVISPTAAVPTYAVQSGTWATGEATLVIGSHVLSSGQQIVVSNSSPTGYNGTYVINSTTATSISYVVADPGSDLFSNATVSSMSVVQFNVGVDPGDVGVDKTVTIRVLPGNIVSANDASFASKIQIRSELTLSNTASWNKPHNPGLGGAPGTTTGVVTTTTTCVPTIHGFTFVGFPSVWYVGEQQLTLAEQTALTTPANAYITSGVEGSSLPSFFRHQNLLVYGRNRDGTRNYDYQLTPGTTDTSSPQPCQGAISFWMFDGPFNHSMIDFLSSRAGPGGALTLGYNFTTVSPRLPLSVLQLIGNTPTGFCQADVGPTDGGGCIESITGAQNHDCLMENFNYGKITVIATDVFAFPNFPETSYGYWEIDYKPISFLEITGPLSININQLYDYTLRIIDYGGNTVTDFVGTVDTFSYGSISGNLFATGHFLPQTVHFTAADRGVKTVKIGAFGGFSSGSTATGFFAAYLNTTDPNSFVSNRNGVHAQTPVITFNNISGGQTAPYGANLVQGSFIPCGATANVSGMSMTVSSGTPPTTVTVTNFRASPSFGTFGVLDPTLKLNDDTTTVASGSTVSYAQISAGLKVNPSINTSSFGGRPGGSLSVDLVDTASGKTIGTITTNWAGCNPT